MSTCDVVDLTKAMVIQSVWILGIALECQEAFADIQTRNNDKLASTEEKLKKIKAEAKEMKA